MTAQPRAAIYCRVDSSDQDGGALDAQEAACRRYAAERGYAVHEGHVYREVADGVRLDHREQLTALGAAVRAGEVAVVIAEHPDRLARDPATYGGLLDEWERAGATLAFVAQAADQEES